MDEGPLLRLGRVVASLSPSSTVTAWVKGLCWGSITDLSLRAWLNSFRGGVGACSVVDEAEGNKGSAAPRGPSGSKDPSTASKRVGCAPILRAGNLREADDLSGSVDWKFGGAADEGLEGAS
jgi:hypothetical protein